MEKYPEKIISSYSLMQVKSFYCKPVSYEEIFECIQFAKQEKLKINPTGSKLSFSNVCLISNNISLDLSALNKIIEFNPDKDEITIQAGILTTKVLAFLMPKGYSLCGLTGSHGNTIGGDIGNDVNGKDSWKNGHFGENVISVKIITADGGISRISRSENPEILNSVIAGMGLTGIIIEATLKLLRIPSFMIQSQSIKVFNLKDLLKTVNNLSEKEIDFAYCWTDPYAPKNQTGRGFCEIAKFTSNQTEFTEKGFLNGFVPKKNLGFLSPEIFWALFRMIDYPFLFKWAGYIKYYSAKSNKKQYTSFPAYQYPMVRVFPQWNLKFYPLGFREMQILFPNETFEEAYKEILSYCRARKFTPNVCAIRKHKAQSPFLSFSNNGFSMTLNYNLNDHSEVETINFENEIIKKIINYKGKLYLGKFPFLNRENVEKMYPAFKTFTEIKGKLDPQNLFWSDAAERLFSNRY